MQRFTQVAERTPHLVLLGPAELRPGPHEAGGIPAVMAEHVSTA